MMIKFKESYSSIAKIKEKFQLNKRFSFQHVSEATVRKVMENLPQDKASPGNVRFPCSELPNCINECLTKNKLPDKSKLSGITSIF